MLTIACVLKSGGDFAPEHVHALWDGVSRHLSLPHKFVCLTDMKVDCPSLPLKHAWPGWWSKLNLFEPGLFDGPVFYMDLDTVLVGPIADMVTGHRFTMLQDWLHPKGFNSSIMAWSETPAGVYEAFLRRGPEKVMRLYRVKGMWGDQDFIAQYVNPLPDRWHRRYPGRIVSYKMDCLPSGGIPSGASIVAFHGKPRPFALPDHERAWFEEAA